MKITFLAAALIFFIAMNCQQTFGQEPVAPEEMPKLVREYAFTSKPRLNPNVKFAIEEFSIPGLKALKLQIVHARYLALDGTPFNEALLLCRDGKLTRFAESLGGQGLMSGVVVKDTLYYTYSFGSGEHRSHLARLNIVDGKVTIVESGSLLDKDYFVSQVGDKLFLEEGEFQKFNKWKSNKRIGQIVATDTGFDVVDEAGNPLPKFGSEK
jgi:hypothetical protein